MISICVPYYPWYRRYDRTPDLFDALIDSLNDIDDWTEVELVIADAGTEDIWRVRDPETKEINEKRHHDHIKFYNDVRRAWPGKFQYTFGPYLHEGRFWMSLAIRAAVANATGDRYFFTGIDIRLPINFINLFNRHVGPGRFWVPMSFNVPRGAEFNMEPGRGKKWHTAHGLIGVTQEDYLKAGGWPTRWLKSNSDSKMYTALKQICDVKEGPTEGFYHLNHCGSNASKVWKVEK